MISRIFSFLFAFIFLAFFLLTVGALAAYGFFLWHYLGEAPSVSRMSMTQATIMVSAPVLALKNPV